MDHVRYRLQIFGTVQGVGFRASTIRQASLLGVSGFVRNMDDGSVLIEAEGTKEQIHALTEWCRHGSNYASVQKVTKNKLHLKRDIGFRLG